MKTVVHCAGCDRPILDRFIFNVLDLAWHANCVKCSDCKCHLSEKCFSREGKLYCRQDFFRRYGTKCSGCGHGISPNDLVRRAKNKVFHLKCFTCMVCRKQLSTGEELYVLDENKFICKDDYVNTRSVSVGLNSPDDQGDLSDGEGSEPGSVINQGPTIDSDSGGLHDALSGLGGGSVGNGGSGGGGSLTSTTPVDKDSSIDGDSNHSGHDTRDNGTPDENTVGGKRRGPRTTIKAKQLETLKAAFAATPKPTRHIREQLAQETGLNMRVIQVWFQNRRSKERRMKQLSTMGARRNFYRNPRRMRALRPGMSPDGPCSGLDDADLNPHHGSGPFGYFPDGGNQGDVYGNQAFYDFFQGQQHGLGHPGHHPGNGPPDSLAGFPTNHLGQTSIEQPVPPGGPLAPGNIGMNHNENHFLPPEMMVGQRNSSPDSVMNVSGSHVTEGGGPTFGGGTNSVSTGNGNPPRSVSTSVESFASPPSLAHPQETSVW